MELRLWRSRDISCDHSSLPLALLSATLLAFPPPATSASLRWLCHLSPPWHQLAQVLLKNPSGSPLWALAVPGAAWAPQSSVPWGSSPALRMQSGTVGFSSTTPRMLLVTEPVPRFCAVLKHHRSVPILEVALSAGDKDQTQLGLRAVEISARILCGHGAVPGMSLSLHLLHPPLPPLSKARCLK